ncbi:CDHR4 protein, partial [Heliornis fulica]|nr:CDHR4 protein [Heliornis fulica]
QVTLRAGAELAHRMNQYTLRAACPGEEEVEGYLFVQVVAGQALRCDGPFASAEGDVVWVPADVAAWKPLYAVLPQPLGGLTVMVPTPLPPPLPVQFRLRNHNTPLRLTRRGLVLAPASGFSRSKDTQTFRLEIEVMDRHGHNCSGAVTVEVMPSRYPRVTFLEPQRAVMVPEGTRPLEVITQVYASGDNVRYAILAPMAPALFTINEVTGEIRSTRQLEVTHTHLLVRAYNTLNPDDHDIAMLNVTVQGTDRQAPSCIPAISVSQVPETVSPGSTLVTLRCTDPNSAGEYLQYSLEGPLSSRYRFRMVGPQLQVNTTLDYDSEAAAAVGFQFTATVVVTAGGQPPRNTRVPLLVTVTPVNEFTPVCPNGAAFTVMETAFGSAVGRVAGTDRDYPRDSLEYSLEGGPGPTQPFAIDTHTGEIRVVGPLNSQQQKSYRLVVRLTDTHNDLDPAKRRSSLCDVAVRLQPTLDQAPVCTPEVQELRITAGLGGRQPVTRLACQGRPDGVTLAYAIIGGNEDGCFRLEGNTLFFLPDALAEPNTFVLLVEVWSSPTVPRRSTMVALVVHVTPQSTPVPPSTTIQHQHTMLLKEPLVVTLTEASWHPTAWFVAVLTASGALLLAALGCVARSLLCRPGAHGCFCSSCSNRDPGKLLLHKSGKGGGGHPGALSTLSSLSSAQGQFDGRAQDPRTGRDYLFNSVTGARRWI